jgi:hypothetical protein
MGIRRLRLVRESILDLPQFRDASNQPLSFRPDSPLAVISDDIADNELIQNYLAQGILVEVDENGKVLPPPAAPALQSDAERGVAPRRENRGAGANPEDGTAPKQNTTTNPALTTTGMPRDRQSRGAGANPEDGTAPRPGGVVHAGTNQVRLDAPKQDIKKGEPAPSAIDENSPTMQAAKAESDMRAGLDEHGNLRQPPGNADAASAEELASRRDHSTMTAESAPKTTPNVDTEQNPDASRGGYGSKRQKR